MAKSFAASTDDYRAVCAEHQVPLFHQPWWLDAVCEQWMGVTMKGADGISALWPVPLEKKLGVRMSRNPALTPYLGPAFLLSVSDEQSVSRGNHAATLRNLIQALPDIPVWHTAAQPHAWDAEIFEQGGFTTGLRPTYLLPLAGATEQALFAGLHAEVRRGVRRAAERITIIDEPDAAADMYALQEATLHRKGTRLYHSAALFARLVKEAQGRGCGALWTARRGGNIVGAQWSVWDAHRCYNIGLTRVESADGKFVPAALLWHAIRHARDLGLDIFDFEGSSVPGIAEFFARFGGAVHPYVTLQKNNSPLWQLVRRIRK